MSAQIERLRAEIRSDRQALSARLEQLRPLTLGPDTAEGDLALAAWTLHHLYSGIEAILERTMRTIEGSLPEGPEYHRALLDSARLELEGVRPALLTSATVRSLHDLRAFRHFVRHAYAVALDATRLADLQTRAVQLFPALDHELDLLDEWLGGLSRALTNAEP